MNAPLVDTEGYVFITIDEGVVKPVMVPAFDKNGVKGIDFESLT